MSNTTTVTPASSVKQGSKMAELLAKDPGAVKIPQVGDLIEGIVISLGKNEVYVDINGVTTGIVRGKEIHDESGDLDDIKIGDRAAATVIDVENEQGLLELSFRFAGHQKAWDNLEKIQSSGEVVEAQVIDANKGGLMIKVGNVVGFLPVSQLTTENYPRVEGGDKNKILAHLKNFAGQKMKVKIIDVHEEEEKMIVSEKAAWEEKQQEAMSVYKVGDTVSGKVTGVVDFGAFVEFGENLEGLVHISELAWQRIDDPREVIHVGDKVKAEIIAIENSKISLSLKKLVEDPWTNVAKKYKTGQTVTGKVLKVNTFGAFVELDKDIHGLAHISELSNNSDNDPSTVVVPGETYDFTVISIEPTEHRLGLSMLKKKSKEDKASATPSASDKSDNDVPANSEAKDSTPA
ncbi:MAG: S1 RNA-binding domain-containing protein [Candidatus Komeilibacteria bacterium]|nr:S1 RNA-binding domain-containing protein [Candidatus Komeilibacteria bacterium]